MSPLVFSSFGSPNRAASCPLGYSYSPFVLLSLDGFRADYLTRGISPNLQELINNGTSAPFMKPTYPTLTFPNHYSIVTGLYPESHGIIANSFYDDVFNDFFSLGSDTSLNGSWWGGEPIWNTVTFQNKNSATFFWPGSDADIQGRYPTYYYQYNDSYPYEFRVEKVLEWLALPEPDRPAWISFYFDEPDHTGHDFGPNSTQVDSQIMYVDSLVGDLLTGIEDLGLKDCVNLVILADHGMVTAGEVNMIGLSEYIPDIENQAFVFLGAFSRIDLQEYSDNLKMEMMQNLSCQRPDLRQYEPQGLPTRFHFSNNRRIEDIVLDIDAGMTTTIDFDFFLEGQHGYDNIESLMNALFIASGPAFKRGITVEPFQNIELYNLMCELVGVVPATNNGTQGSLYHLLEEPPAYPSVPQEALPPVASYPLLPSQRLDISECSGDLTSVEPWLSALSLSEAEQATSEIINLPWGLMQTGELKADLTLLHQYDHVTGFSTSLKMPLWTSFTLSTTELYSIQELWSSDVRLNSSNTPTCTEYTTLLPQNLTMMPLFPPAHSVNASLPEIPYVISNAVPASLRLKQHWTEITETLLQEWLNGGLGPFNVALGPVFDLDANSLVDNYTDFTVSLQPPSHFFAVFTRCTLSVTDLSRCPHEDLDTQSYIYPQDLLVENCLDYKKYAKEFMATLRDVEKISGLYFFPDLDFRDKTRIAIRIHTEVWN